MQGEFRDHIALVTGGSRGIGRAICLCLSSLGAAVAVHYNSREDAVLEVSGLIAEKGGRSAALQTELSKPGSGTRLVESTVNLLGGIDILINNAGIMTDSPVSGMTDELWEHSLAVNLTSAFRCARAAIPHMKEKGWGRIISLTSQAAYTGSSNHAHYAAAKAGLLGFTYSLAKELGDFGITVNAVAPGFIQTDMTDHLPQKAKDAFLDAIPLGRPGTAEDVAGVVAFLVSPDAAYMTGQTLHVDGGMVMS